jgi:tetratricopeptide (TPR) repeat protein
LPIIEVIRRASRIGYEREPLVVEQKLRGGLEIAGLPVERHLPYLANLLGVNIGVALDNVDPETIGIRTRETLQQILREQCRMSPVVMLIEDLHWIDSASMAYLHWMAEAEEPMPLLVLCAYRPEIQPPWRDRLNATELTLTTLSRVGAIELLNHRLGVQHLPETVADTVVDRAEGNPLFIEELANYLSESGIMPAIDGALSQRNLAANAGVPSNLESLLMQRVDRLDAGPREVLKAASVIGGLFTLSLIGSVIAANTAVSSSLNELVRHDLLVTVSATDNTRYRIKHALIGDALRNSLLSGEREALHLATAKAIERAYAGNESEAADALAHHYNHTSHVEKRMHYLYLAGQKSLQVHSIQEAHERFREALDLLEVNPNAVDRVFTIDLILANSRAYYLLGDYARMIPLTERYLPIVEEMGDKSRLSHCLSELGHARLGHVHMDIARPEIAMAYLDRALALAREINDEGAVGHASMVLAAYHVFWQPPSPEARETVFRLAEQAFEIGKRIDDNWLTAEALAIHAYSALINGKPGEGRKQVQRLLELSRTDENPYARQLGLFNLALIDNYNNAPEEAIQKIDETLRIGLSPLYRSLANACKGAALAMAGQSGAAYELLQKTRQEAVDKDQLFVFIAMDYNYGVAQILNGDIAKGVRWIEKSMRWFSGLGLTPFITTIGHLTLGEVYLSMVLGDEKPSLQIVLKNLGFILRTMPFATAKARHHLEEAERGSRMNDAPGLLAWSLMDLGLLAQAKKHPAEARTYLEEAIQVAETVDAFATAEKSKAALEGLV